MYKGGSFFTRMPLNIYGVDYDPQVCLLNFLGAYVEKCAIGYCRLTRTILMQQKH